ncbi:MAG: hypothetical protein RMJ43_16070 [Chloroherpetonaceae bacterium]|nr:hypothetical protein [Chthonomonadaceae bacterium]MDW8209351.1 hypothetical protein [Chloroherpetonaceae bacterium]
MRLRHLLTATTLVLALPVAAPAQIITLWNFNSPVPDNNTSTGTTAPAIGAGTASLIGGTTATFASGTVNGGSTDPAPSDNSGWNVTNFPTQGTGSGTAGVQFRVSTVGFSRIGVQWDQRHSNTASRFVQFQYSIDGVNFTALPTLFVGNAGDTWFNNRFVDLSGIAGVNNNPNFAFRIVSVFEPSTSAYRASNPASTYATTGTWRFDMVRVGVVPGPSSLLVFACGGLAPALTLLRRRRTA